MHTLKRTIHTMFHEPHTRLFVVANSILALLTIGSVFALILETVESFEAYHEIFLVIEVTAVLFFTLEYIGRIIISEKKGRYLFSFFGIIDLLAVLPSYLLLTNLTFLKSARLLHVIRILRVLRVIKLVDAERTSPHTRKQGGILEAGVHYYLTGLSLAVIILGSFLWAAETGNAGAADIPVAMLWVSQVILGLEAITPFETQTLWGDMIIVLTRFTGLLLFGFLIYLAGHKIDTFLYGDTDPTRPSPAYARAKGK